MISITRRRQRPLNGMTGRVSSGFSCNLAYLLAVVTDSVSGVDVSCAAADAVKVKRNKTAVNVTPVQFNTFLS